MNPKRERFCLIYAKTGNATKAAIEAGYSHRTARSQAQRLLTFVDVQARIRQLVQERRSELIASVEDTQIFLSALMNDEHTAPTHRLKAAELLLRCQGAFLPAPAETDVESVEEVVIYLPENHRNEEKEIE